MGERSSHSDGADSVFRPPPAGYGKAVGTSRDSQPAPVRPESREPREGGCHG